MNTRNRSAAGALIVLSFCAAAQGGYVQEWNDPGKGADNWYYWSTTNGEPLVPWSSTGGQDGGCTSIDLSLLGDWGHWVNNSGYGSSFAEQDYYPAYGSDWPPVSLRPGIDRTMKVAIRDLSSTSAPLNLAGGQLEFWIGNSGTGDGNGYTYYAFKTPLSAGTGDWTDNTLALTTDPADWLFIGESQGQSLADLLAGPVSMVGFRIVGGSAAPQGTLGFDNFQLVPEPTTLMVLAVGGLAMIRRRHP